MQNNQFDVCIVGGGMVGAALALGLAKQNYTVALIEKSKPQAYSSKQAPDIRLSAFNMHSIKLLSQLGAWPYVLKKRYRNYDTLSVWEDETSITQFTAQEVNQKLLGCFVENRLIQLSLYEAIDASQVNNVAYFFDHKIRNIDPIEGSIEFADNTKIQCSLMIGADGANSSVRNACGIATSGWEYAQQANVILVKMKQPIPDETWQAFHPNGPRALLPMHEQYASLVWYDSAAQSHWIQKAHQVDLKVAIKKAFSTKLGDFDIISVAGFGLTRMHAMNYGKHKAIILGDAAHTINPLAGQGINLGFKDVSALLELIAENGLSDVSVLTQSFESKRKPANLLMMSSMDVLYLTFSTPLLPIKLIRNLGLKLANNAGPIKHQALQYAMGLK